jgi:hypothetical protein
MDEDTAVQMIIGVICSILFDTIKENVALRLLLMSSFGLSETLF